MNMRNNQHTRELYTSIADLAMRRTGMPRIRAGGTHLGVFIPVTAKETIGQEKPTQGKIARVCLDIAATLRRDPNSTIKQVTFKPLLRYAEDPDKPVGVVEILSRNVYDSENWKSRNAINRVMSKQLPEVAYALDSGLIKIGAQIDRYTLASERKMPGLMRVIADDIAQREGNPRSTAEVLQSNDLQQAME